MRNGPYELVKAPDGYPGKLYRGKYCYEHHLVWWENTGELLDEDECIHHKNGNKRDNRFENLEKEKVSDHSYKHRQKAKYLVFWCPSCGNVFFRRKNQSNFYDSGKFDFCSRACIGKSSNQYERIDNQKPITNFKYYSDKLWALF